MEKPINCRIVALCMLGAPGKSDRCLKEAGNGCLGDELSLPILGLARSLKKFGIECHTPDIFDPECYDAYLFYEMPVLDDPIYRVAKESGKPMFVIVVENHFILPGNADYARYGEFAAVFTYNDDPVRKGIAHKLNYACSLKVPDYASVPFSERKLAVMVSSYIKPRKNKRRLCSYVRLKTIRFYEDLGSNDFDLYGYGWGAGMNLFQDRPGIFRLVSALKLYEILPRRKLKTWRGTIDGLKRDVVCNYRFAYCYENTTEIPGYITEKIFDVMMSGAVPVYLGHVSASDRIPKSCYIDRADFADDAELYAYLSRMSEETWRGYLEAAREFLLSEQAREFSVPEYVKKVTGVMLPLLGVPGAGKSAEGTD